MHGSFAILESLEKFGDLNTPHLFFSFEGRSDVRVRAGVGQFQFVLKKKVRSNFQPSFWSRLKPILDYNSRKKIISSFELHR